jgi:lipid II:glycine glycyltransferase (peptidoglycan interpeptide bridge formation enzyme)
MAIEIITDRDQWDKFIDDSPYGMLFHKWDLLKVIQKHTGYDLRTYGIFKGEELIAVLPMFYTHKMGVKLAYSPPQGTLVYIPYMGLVMGKEHASHKQQKRESNLDLACADIDRELKNNRANIMSFTFMPEMIDVRPFLWEDYDIRLFYTYMINLERPVEAIWDSFEKDCRREIKISAKLGIHCKQHTDVDLFYEIMTAALKDKGNTFFIRQSKEYLKDLIAAYPRNIKMYFLYLNEEAIGVYVNCEYKDLCICWLGNGAPNRNIASNEYNIWEMIKIAKSAGYKRLELWGGDMKRLNMFKSKFNPVLVPYYHVSKKDAIGKMADVGYTVVSSAPVLSSLKR